MRQGLVRLILLVIVLLLIFGVYRLLTIEPIDAGAFFNPEAGPLVLVEPEGGDAAPLTLAAFQAAAAGGATGFYTPVSLAQNGELVAAAAAETSDGASGQVVSLDQLLTEFPDARFAVELREPSLQSLAALLHSADTHNARGRLLALVDDQQLVETLRQQAPDLATALTSGETSTFLTVSRFGLAPFYRPVASGLILPAEQFSARTARSAQSGGMAVLVVAPQESDDPLSWIEQGADGVIIGRSQAAQPD